MGARMQHQATPTAQRNARELRRGMTYSERKLWSGLRAKQLGVKFRRQHPRKRVLTAILDQLKTLAGDAPIPAFPQRGKEELPRSTP
jgi:very-short-patch-repair endonuclease